MQLPKYWKRPCPLFYPPWQQTSIQKVNALFFAMLLCSGQQHVIIFSRCAMYSRRPFAQQSLIFLLFSLLFHFGENPAPLPCFSRERGGIHKQGLGSLDFVQSSDIKHSIRLRKVLCRSMIPQRFGNSKNGPQRTLFKCLILS